jgi:hypothetical protein
MPDKFTNEFATCLTEIDLVDAAAVVCAVGQYTELGRFTVPAGRGISPGNGAMAGQDSAKGRLYAHIADAADASLDVILRLAVHNPSDRVEATLFELPARRLNTIKDNPTTWYPFSFIGAIIKEDSALVLKARPMGAAALTVALAKTVITMDATDFEAR